MLKAKKKLRLAVNSYGPRRMWGGAQLTREASEDIAKKSVGSLVQWNEVTYKITRTYLEDDLGDPLNGLIMADAVEE